MQVFKLSRAAEDDLFKIRKYTQDHWGEAQRDKYLDDIEERFHLLAKNPDYPTSNDLSHIKQGYFSLPVNKHFIIYRKYSYGVRIVRVLGQIMDIKKHL